MLVSYNWLKELVDLNGLTPEEIANKLTFAGVEVESVSKLSNATNLIVGKVIECEDVPETHLHLCKIDLGSEGIKQIICGAPNVRKGLKVIVALPGAKLPGGEIKVTTIRGFESNGMCCSLLELGVDSKYVSDTDLHGIHELDNTFKVGDKDVLNKLGLDDTILNLKLLANRPDLLSIYNVAREVSSLFNRKLKSLKIKPNEFIDEEFKVGSETKLCSQFSSRIIRGITVKESPNELKKKLIAMGVRPISNIVDIGNYIMLLTGQPLHMYDYDKLPVKELIAKDDYDSNFVALDNKSYKLEKGDIVITSNNQVMCLGGVMGGLSSSDDKDTKNIVIESASFNGASVRRTSTRLNLISESSMRFTHGTNNNQYVDVIELASSLIKKYCGASSMSNIVTYDSNNHEEHVIHTTVNKINELLGTSYNIKTIKDVLTKDHFKVINVKKKNEFDVIVPAFRIDVDGEHDIAEEVIRILGFNDVKNELPKLKCVPGIFTESQRKVREIKSYLRNSLYEVATYVLVNSKKINEFTYLNSNTPYKLINPMTDDHEYVRRGLMPSLLEVVSYNLAHQNKDFGIFEISDINVNDKKDLYLGIILTGKEKRQNELNKVDYSFYNLKGYLEGILSMLGIEKSRYTLKDWDLGKEELHPGRSASIYLGKDLIGYLGEMHPNAYKTYNIKNNKVYVLEVKLSSLINLPVGNIKFKPLSKYPSVNRDLALVVSDNIKADYITNIVRKSAGPLLKDVQIFDIYKDEMMNDKKSVAISITLCNENATLKDNETNEIIERIKVALLKEGITLR